MDNLVAKRYAKAILAQKNADEFYELLSAVAPAFGQEKFRLILGSNELDKQKKLEFVRSLFDKPKANFVNFLQILAQNSRLDLIPQILRELARQKALKEQIYQGVVFSQKLLDKKALAQLEKKLSDKFKVSIKLSNETSEAKGIKISLDELGYELGFSMDSLKAKMSEFILKNL